MAEPFPVVWRVNHHPRFTVLEFGEYMAADDGPRDTILRNLKYERLARSLSYRDIDHSIAQFLASPTRDHRILARRRELLEHERATTINPQQRDNLSYQLQALEAFERSLNALELAGLNFERVPFKRLPMEGVSISVRPTVGIRVRRVRGADLVGALIVDLAKGASLRTDDAQQRATKAMIHAAIVLHLDVTDALCADGTKPSQDHCVVFHSYRGERVAAPSNYRRVLRNMEAVCRGVSRGWDKIEPPPNFDERQARHRSN
jgi:hypothetical protein